MAALKRNQGRDLARRSGKTGRKRSRDRGEGWVRKTVVMDQRKLDAARRVLGVETDTGAIDVALDLVAFRRELVRGLPPSDARAALKMCSRPVRRDIRARYERVRGCGVTLITSDGDFYRFLPSLGRWRHVKPWPLGGRTAGR